MLPTILPGSRSVIKLGFVVHRERRRLVFGAEELVDRNPDQAMKIWVDADACPAVVRELLFRTARRLQIELVLVANQTLRVPGSRFVRAITVTDGADRADQKIVELIQPGDVVITADVPLAARVVAKKGVAICPRGQLFDESTVHEQLAARNLMDHLRSAGIETSRPRPLNQKDVQAFANQLDRILTRRLGTR